MQPALPSEPVPLPRTRPGAQPAPRAKPVTPQPTAAETAPLSLAPGAPGGPVVLPPANAPSAIPSSQATPAQPRMAAPIASAPGGATSPLDVTAVKQAIDLVRKTRQDEATGVEGSITDPVARKLVEWVILRSEDSSASFSRYNAFIAANPSWPSLSLLRRRAETVLW